MTVAFETALNKPQLVDCKDPLTTVAKLIIQLVENEERDPQKLCDEGSKAASELMRLGTAKLHS